MNLAALLSFHHVEDSVDVSSTLVSALNPSNRRMTRCADMTPNSFFSAANAHMMSDETALSANDLTVSRSIAVSVRGEIACFLEESVAAGENSTT